MDLQTLKDTYSSFVLENYRSLTQKEMREHIGCSNTQLCRLINELGISEEIKKLSWYRVVDESIPLLKPRNWFYFVGLMLADGWVTEKGLVAIRLSYKDKQLLDDLTSWLKFKGTLYVGKAKADSLVSKERQFCQLSFTSKIFYQELLAHGVCKNKTGHENYKNIPDFAFLDFLRGFMDGDGNISNGSIRLYSNSLDVLYHIKDDLKRLYGVEAEFLNSTNSTYRITINSKFVHFFLKDKMYDSDCLCLKRKKDSLLSYVPKRNQKFINEYVKG